MAITAEQFKVGDRVKWATTKRGTTSYPVKFWYEGVIDEIRGSEAMIRRPGRYRRQRVKLFKLEVKK